MYDSDISSEEAVDERRKRGPGKTTFARILKATGEVLQESGYEGLGCKAVAQRAGVSTATLYRYFPDKHAVLQAFVMEMQTERSASIRPYIEEFKHAADWRKPIEESVREVWRLRKERPGVYAARRALQSSPKLMQWDQQLVAELAVNFAEAIRSRKPNLSPKKANTIALVMVTANIALLDLATACPAKDDAIIDEAVKLRLAYLADYLD